MRTPKSYVLVLLIACCAFVLAACGGGDSDEDQITDAIVEFSTAGNDACEVVTEDFLEESFDERGSKAVDACEDAIKEAGDDEDTPKADDVEVTDVDIDGDKATADVEAKDDRGTVELVKEDGDWKIADFEEDESSSDSSDETETETEPTASISKEEYGTKVEEICGSAKTKSEALEKELDDLEQGDTKGLAGLLSRLAAVYRDDLEAPIKALPIPEGDATSVGTIHGTLEALVEQTAKTAEAASGGDTAAIQGEIAGAQSTQKSVDEALKAYDIDCDFEE